MKIEKNLFIPGKLSYVKGDKPDVECILCGIRDRDQRVRSLEITRTGLMLVSLNLFPYNPGHLMIFPLRHITEPREMTAGEVRDMHELQCRMTSLLEKVYQPRGFNIGYNIGDCSGASIAHLHCHLVPRYPSEIGLLEMVSDGSRVIVEDPSVTLEKLRSALGEPGTDS